MNTYKRFLEYVKINTQSDEDSGTHPSFAGEFDLAKMLQKELEDMGIRTYLDDKCYLMAWIEATEGFEDAPALGFISHLDSAPAYSGKDVNPILWNDYNGADVTYPSGKIMKVSDFPFLEKLKGQTLITSDGNTLLSADDKAGISEIMTAAKTLTEEGRPHGKICIAFTPDEEIGQGADDFDVERFGAKFAYTVDGGDVNEIEYENFNAASATITIHGVSVHPGTAKNVMVNALNVAHELHSLLPSSDRPEHTEGYEGFYHLTNMSGNCDSAKLDYIIRDHDMARFEERKAFITDCVRQMNEKYKDGTVVLDLKDSYYNMLEKIRPHMHLIETAKKAIKKEGMDPVEVPIRGGTDGARLSYMNLPCPNLGTGGFNFHGPFECTTVERLDEATRVILNIIEEYSHSVVK